LRKFSNEWASILVENVSGMRVNEDMKKNIFEPLGLTSTGMFLDEHQQSRLEKMNFRSLQDGTLSEISHYLQASLDAQTPEAWDATF
jgi:CubicO group peptidase (beta-lactamase class C family)